MNEAFWDGATTKSGEFLSSFRRGGGRFWKSTAGNRSPVFVFPRRGVSLRPNSLKRGLHLMPILMLDYPVSPSGSREPSNSP
jgi:hypothetical protein